MKYYAAIDIGSNAVRLLIKRVNESEPRIDKRLSKVIMLRVPLRLGFDVFKNGKVSSGKVKKLVRLMKAYRQLLKIYEVSSYRACATSAMRDAANGAKIIDDITKETGIKVDLIDGEEEARIVYSNHMECMEDRRGNYLYVDVGGGSTEINFLVDGDLRFTGSYNIGTVRMLNDAVKVAVWEKLTKDLNELVIQSGSSSINIIGSGGNINKLFRLSKDSDKDRLRLPIESLCSLYQELSSLNLEERMSRYNLKPDRADVIVPAAKIFINISEIVKAEYIHVPVLGLADGIIDLLYQKDCLLGRETNG